MKKELICSFLLLLLYSAMPQSAFGWGPAGHQIIARLADERLSGRARKSVSELLGGASLESVANWADVVRVSGKETPQSHFLDLALDKYSYSISEDCPDGRCLIEALRRNIATLSDSGASRSNRVKALKFVIHLLGDLHQPLHCAEKNNDKGGNLLRVSFFGTPTNLHKIWDTDIIEHTGLNIDAYVKTLDGGSPASTQGTIIDWALESHKLAYYAYRSDGGDVRKGSDLRDSYFNTNRPIVDEQLLKAGTRLAETLNAIFQSRATQSVF